MQSRLGHALVLMAVIAPMLTGIVVRTFAWMTILQDKGVINTTLIAWGLIEKPLPLMYNEFGTVVALVHIYVPFMVLTLTGVIGRIDERLEQAARSLGAGRLRAFVEVTLPLSLPGILAGSLLVFALSISAYVTPSLMGGTDVLTLPMLIAQQVGTSFNPNFAGALGVVLLLVSLAIVVAYNRILAPAVGRAGAGMSAAANTQPFDAGAPPISTLNGALLAFLLAPIAIVHRVRAQSDAVHLLPAGRRQPALVREVLRQQRLHECAVAVAVGGGLRAGAVDRDRRRLRAGAGARQPAGRGRSSPRSSCRR